MLYDAYVQDDKKGSGEYVECFIAGVSTNLSELYRVASYADASGKVIVPAKGTWIVVEEFPDIYNLIVVQGNNHNISGKAQQSNILYNVNGVSVEHNRTSGEFSINVNSPTSPAPPPVTTDGSNIKVTETPSISSPIFSIVIDKKGAVSIGGTQAMFALVNETLVDLFNAHVHPTAIGPTSAPLVPIIKTAVTTKFLKSL